MENVELSEEKVAENLEIQKLLDAKNSRKKVEDDAKLLANRIALLENEEKKAKKKIEETRKRTQEILKLRKEI